MVQITCNKARAEARGREVLTVGMSNAVTVGFDFSSEWAGLSKTAVFTNGKTTVDVLESQWTDGAAVDIPHEVLTEEGRRVQVGIYGTDGTRVVLPTVWATLGVVLPAAEPSGDVSTDPTLPVWAQLQKEIDGIGAPSQEDIAAAVEEYLEENPVEAPVTSVNGMTGDVQVSGEVKVVDIAGEEPLCHALREAFADERAPYVISTAEEFPYTIYAPSESSGGTAFGGEYTATGIAVSSVDGAVYQYSINSRDGNDHWGNFRLTKLTPEGTLTVNFSRDDDGNYSADKTFAEIEEAARNGAAVIGRMMGIAFPLALVFDETIIFAAGASALDVDADSERPILFDCGVFFIAPDNAVDYMAGPISGVQLPLLSDIPTKDDIRAATSLVVTVTESSDGTATCDTPYEKITAALDAGNCVTCQLDSAKRESRLYAFSTRGDGYICFAGATKFSDDNGDGKAESVFSPGGVFVYNNDTLYIDAEDEILFSDFAKKTDIPETLPSPHALTLTGAVEAEYDGSADVEVEIPAGDTSLGITGAEVGQTVKITAVDDDGRPTAWEAADASGGGTGKFRLLRYLETTEDVSRIDIETDDNGNAFECQELYAICKVWGTDDSDGGCTALLNKGWGSSDPYTTARPSMVKKTEGYYSIYSFRAVVVDNNGDGTGGGVFGQEVGKAGAAGSTILPSFITAIPALKVYHGGCRAVSLVAELASECKIWLYGR